MQCGVWGLPRFAAMWVLVAVGLAAVPISAQGATTPLQVENETLRLRFSPANGALLSAFHKPAGLELLSISSQAGGPLWILEFLDADGSYSWADTSNTAHFTSALTADSSGQTLQMVWQGLSLNGSSFPNTAITVVVKVQNGNPLSSWTWRAQNMPGAPVSWVAFPNFSGLGPLSASGSGDVLLWPGEDGRLIQNPWANLGWGWGNGYPSAFTAMQFVGLYNSSGGFYFATQDTQARAKGVHFERDSQSAGDFQFRIYNEFDDVSSAALQLPYDFLLGTFTGDWTTAAEIYRQWAVQQPWVLKAPQKQTPQWLFDIGPAATFCAHGCQPVDRSYAEGTALRQSTTQFFQMQELSILWGWEGLGYGIFPPYFPPAESWASFDTFVTSIHQIPGRVGLFISPIWMTASTALWAGGTMQPYAALGATGNLESIDLEGRQYIQMEIATPAWQEEVLSVVNTLAQHAIDLVQLDGFPWNAPYQCYAKTHGHPIGFPATWQTSAWFSFLSAMRASAKAIKPDIAFSSEGIAEVYIPYIDMHHSRDNWFELIDYEELALGASPIPLFEYVYHPWIVTRGDYCLGMDTRNGLSDYQKLAIARSLTWGQEHNYTWQQALDDDPFRFLDMQAMTYVKTVTAARQGFAKPYLVYGQMLPPAAITSPMLPISWSFTDHGSGSANFPAIQHSAWRGPDGSIGIVLTNISSQTVSVSVPISFSKLGLSANTSYAVLLVDANSTSLLLNPLTSDSAVTISVAPLQVELVKIAALQPPVVTGVANAAGGQPVVASGSFVSIYGSNFTPLAYDDWGKSVVNGQLPTRLDGVSVTIGGAPAYVSAITPNQINVQAPDVGNASVQVVATTSSGSSVPFAVNSQLYSPAFFLWPGNQAVADHTDYSPLARDGTFPGTHTVPGKPGEVIVLWGTGFGPTNPPVPAGRVPTVQGPPTQAPVSVTLGGMAVPVLAAVLSSYAALYQIAIQIPTSMADGDYPIIASVNGVSSPSNVLLSVRH